MQKRQVSTLVGLNSLL